MQVRAFLENPKQHIQYCAPRPGVELARRQPASKGSLSLPHLFYRIHTPLICLRIFSYALTSRCSVLLVPASSLGNFSNSSLVLPALVRSGPISISKRCHVLKGANDQLGVRAAHRVDPAYARYGRHQTGISTVND